MKAITVDSVVRTTRSPRATQIVEIARELLEREGPGSLTMRALAERLGIRAPSIYKHFRNKEAVELALIESALIEVGEVMYAALAEPERITSLLAAYRAYGLEHPNLYRLSTTGALDRRSLPKGLEEWSGAPFFIAAKEPHLAQALWSFAHGMVMLELDQRYPPGSELDKTWREGIKAFSAAVHQEVPAHE